ncbi:MAG: ATP-binding protein [Bacteroidales bacterium]|nr:ATP-binding protein [Bacteroidales bacterium]
MKIEEVDIKNMRGLKDFKIDFKDENENPLTLAIIIGVNGTGKTTLLDFIATSIEDIKNETDLRSGNILWIESGKSPISEIVSSHNASTLLNERNNHLIEYYPAEASPQDTSEVLEKYVIDYIDKLVFENDLRAQQGYEKVREYIESIFHDSESNVRFEGISAKRKLRFSNSTGAEFGTENLSSGERKMLAKLLPIYLGEMQGKVLLFDEPENSLHPAWQRELLPALRRASLENDCQIIIATHSPHIIGGAKGEEIRILMREPDGQIVSNSPDDGPFGWEVDSILFYLQGLRQQRTPEVDAKLEKLMDEAMEGKDATQNPLFIELENLLGVSDKGLIGIRAEILRQRRHEKNQAS